MWETGTRDKTYPPDLAGPATRSRFLLVLHLGSVVIIRPTRCRAMLSFDFQGEGGSEEKYSTRPSSSEVRHQATQDDGNAIQRANPSTPDMTRAQPAQLLHNDSAPCRTSPRPADRPVAAANRGRYREILEACQKPEGMPRSAGSSPEQGSRTNRRWWKISATRPARSRPPH